MKEYDVIVVGAGNAALCAALSANEYGARVLVLEKAPKEARGGDTRCAAAALRFAYKSKEELLELLPDLTEEEKEVIDVFPYTEDDFYRDMMRMSKGKADPEWVEMVVKKGRETFLWLMKKHGLKYELAMDFLLRWKGRIAVGALAIQAKGAGEGLVNMEFDAVEKAGIDVLYETKATKLLIDDKGKITGVRVKDREGYRDIECKAVVLACGGFQANPEMRCKYLGRDWDIVKVRGSRYNTGDGIRMAEEVGAQLFGHWSSCHTTVIDADSPDFESGMAYSRYLGLPYGILVNIYGKRFMDEGPAPLTDYYAKTGYDLMAQPECMAYMILDEKSKDLVRGQLASDVCRPVVAGSIEELAKKIDMDPDVLVKTVKEFNDSIPEESLKREFHPWRTDGRCTKGIFPPKSNWALKIDTPPFRAYPITAGITFTFGGLKINTRSEVLDTDDNPIPGLFAAGEVVGGFFYYVYPGGGGLTRGSVNGRVAGANAAKYALGKE